MESVPTQEAKWKNYSIDKWKEVYDVLVKLEQAIPLPEGKILDRDLLHRMGEDLMNYAENVLAIDKFWEDAPEEIPTLSGGTVKRDDLKKELSALIEASR